MKMLWTLPLILTAGMAQAAGFTSADLEAAAQTTSNMRAEISAETERLRLAFAYDPARGLQMRSEEERIVLLGALRTGEGAGDLRVKWFMAGAIAQPSRGATTVLYNPLARGALALDWVKTDEGWRVAHAWLSSSGPAQWPAQQVAWRKAFAEDYAAARIFPGDAGSDFVDFESDRWLGSLAQWSRLRAHMKAAEAARALIADGKTAKVGGGNIDLIPERARKTYAPIGAIARNDGGAAVIFGSAVMPHLLIAADFAGSADARLEKLSLINLANVGAAK